MGVPVVRHPSMNYALLFPGQGAQYVGMGADLFNSSSNLLVDVADEVLGWSLRDLCSEGPEESLTRTEHAQPALFALAYAQWLLFSQQVHQPPAAAAGHSLGEYTALAAAGVLAFPDALSLVSQRGRAMAAAADLEPSAMAALLGASPEAAEAVTDERRQAGGRLWVANLNAPGQVVVAGGQEDIAWVVDNARDLGIRRAVALNVAGAFHTPFMASAATALAEAVAAVPFNSATFPVYSNVTAAPTAGDVGAGMVAQMTSPVRFSDSLARMAADGIDVFVHVGPGDVTAGMAKRSAPDAEILVVNDDASMATAVARLSDLSSAPDTTEDK